MTEYARPANPGAEWAESQRKRKDDVLGSLRGHAAYCTLIGVASCYSLFKSTKGIACALLPRGVALAGMFSLASVLAFTLFGGFGLDHRKIRPIVIVPLLLFRTS